MQEKMIDAKAVAELLSVSVYAVYRLASKKDGLRGYKIGARAIRFKPSDVDAYLAAQEIKPVEKAQPFPGMGHFKYVPGMKVV